MARMISVGEGEKAQKRMISVREGENAN